MTEWLLLAPVGAFVLAALALFVIDMISPDATDSGLLAGVATAGSIAALAASGVLLLSDAAAGGVELFGGQLVVDGMSLLFTFIFGSVTALVSVASLDYIRGMAHQA